MIRVGLITLLCFFLLAQAGFAQDYTTGMEFLQIGVGARSCGMGEAFSSIADDASGLFWNPAGINKNQQKELLFIHNEWLVGTRYESISGIIPTSKMGTFGLGLIYFSHGTIEGRNEQGHHISDYSAYDFALLISYSQKIKSSICVGITGKVIQSKIETENGTGYFGDIGLLYRGPLKGLQIGLTVQHLGTGVKFINNVTKSPTCIRGGFSYIASKKTFNIIQAIDLYKVIDGEFMINVGSELSLKNRLFIRGGYKINSPQGGLTAGFGIIQKISLFQMKLDYAYGGYGDIGISHSLSVGIVL